MHVPRLRYKNIRWGGLRAPGPLMLAVGLALAGVVLFNVTPRGIVVVTAVAVVAVVLAGFVNSNEETPPQPPRKLEEAQLERAHKQVTAPRPRPSRQSLRQSKELLRSRPAQANPNARPSRTWRQRKGTSQAVLLGLFSAWAITNAFVLKAIRQSLDSGWDKQSKGLSVGTWMILALFLASFVAFVPVASAIEGRITRRYHRRPNAAR